MTKAMMPLGKGKRFKSSLCMPREGLVEGGKIGGLEWGPPPSLTPAANTLRIFFSVDQYSGLFMR